MSGRNGFLLCMAEDWLVDSSFGHYPQGPCGASVLVACNNQPWPGMFRTEADAVTRRGVILPPYPGLFVHLLRSGIVSAGWDGADRIGGCGVGARGQGQSLHQNA
jgi:hypothetical protein